MDVRVIYRTCPTCGARFGQPDDPGRKRRFCSDACKQAAYRARKRAREQSRQRAEDGARRRQREEQARRVRDPEAARSAARGTRTACGCAQDAGPPCPVKGIGGRTPLTPSTRSVVYAPPATEEAAMAGDVTGERNPQVRERQDDPTAAAIPDEGPWEGNPHANGPASWLIHTPDSWARSLLAETLRWFGTEASAMEAPLTLRARRLEDGSIRVHVAWQGNLEPHHRITLRP
jgi:hypothetical protein